MMVNSALRRLRLERGLSQEALARQAGVSVSTLSSFENGWRPACHSERAVDIARVLAVPVADLFDGYEPSRDCGVHRRRPAGAAPSTVESQSGLRRIRLERELSV